MTDEVVAIPAFDAVGATGDLTVTLPAALAVSTRFGLPVILDRGEQKRHGAERRFDWSWRFQGGRILWIDWR